MDNETLKYEKKAKQGSKVLLVCLFFIVGVAGGIVGYFISDKFLAKEEVKDVGNSDNKENSDNENKPAEQSPYEKFLIAEIANRTEKEIMKSDDEDSGYEIRLTKSGDVIANVKANDGDKKDIVDQVIESKVVKYFIVNVGMSDVGDSRELVFIKEDGTITSISLGHLLISNEVKINKSYTLKNITEVYDKVTTPTTEYEPAGYSVFVKDIEGKETNITKLIEATRN